MQPSVDPAFANPDNEIWLDFRTDDAGSATAEASVAYSFTPDRRPASVVVHAMPTATGAGQAGTAGGRAACVSVEF